MKEIPNNQQLRLRIKTFCGKKLKGGATNFGQMNKFQMTNNPGLHW
jgi:hypothetical protein